MTYYVYIMASESRALYTGVTNDIERRVHEHQQSNNAVILSEAKACPEQGEGNPSEGFAVKNAQVKALPEQREGNPSSPKGCHSEPAAGEESLFSEARRPSFSARYKTRNLVHLEIFGDIRAAIAREKQIKGWLRIKKLDLIRSTNPNWQDLSAQWCDVKGVILSGAKNPSETPVNKNTDSNSTPESNGKRDSSPPKPKPGLRMTTRA
jgi:predicted GIY-YIG superfamily endonuclease